MGIIQYKCRLLLCHIVEKTINKRIEGIIPYPNSKEESLNNIQKALVILSQRNIIPMYYSCSAEKVFEGDSEFIIGLLKNIRHSYRMIDNTTKTYGIKGSLNKRHHEFAYCYHH